MSLHNNKTPRPWLKNTGNRGESLATDYLIQKRFTITDRNYSTRWGEIDIIAQKDNRIHFIEVKTRYSLRQGMPYEAVTLRKLIHLLRAIQFYILLKNLKYFKYQLDVISITMNKMNDTYELKLYENIDVDRAIR